MHQFLAGKKMEFDNLVSYLSSELSSVRTGRASVALVDGIKVNVYEQMQDLKNVASISTPDSTTIQIDPWDAGVVQSIEKALMEADLGITPSVSGKIIRLHIPPLTEDTRKQMVKVIGKKVEESRISVRNVRDEIKKEVERMEKEKEIGEDERYQLQEELDALVKEINDKMDAVGKNKEVEIMTV